MHTALMGLRTDPSTAHGYAPSELLLGRKLVYPVEFDKKCIDLSGNFSFHKYIKFSREHYITCKSIFFTNTDSFSHQHAYTQFSREHYSTCKSIVFTNTDSFSHQHVFSYFLFISEVQNLQRLLYKA